MLALSPESLAAFDADLARVLGERFAEPLSVEHRIWGIIAEKGGPPQRAASAR